MERIKNIWNQLEYNKSDVAGLFKIRYSDTSSCDVYLGLKLPEFFRILILKVPFLVGKDFNFKYEFRGLKFEKAFDPDDSKYLLLNLILTEKQFSDIFDSFISDIIRSIINIKENSEILRIYTNRLIKWQTLFEKFNQNNLSPEEQRGLYGELYFLRSFLERSENYLNVVNSWVGPEKENRDFHYGNWGCEVKTTHGNNHQKVYISNERQLDTSNLDWLFLNHISLEVLHNSGESLNEIIISISDKLITDILSLNNFKVKLMEAGYFEKHKSAYEKIGYSIRNNSYYSVRDNFPRIQENDIRTGVGDVKYSIILSQCPEYLVSESFVFEKINFWN